MLFLVVFLMQWDNTDLFEDFRLPANVESMSQCVEGGKIIF